MPDTAPRQQPKVHPASYPPAQPAEIVREFGPFPGTSSIAGVSHDGQHVWAAGGTQLLAIDPGFRTGCKVAALDETGNVLEHTIIHPHPPQKRTSEAKARLEEMVRRHQASVIAIGNGTACRDTEELVATLIAELDARRRGEPLPTPPAEPPVQPSEAGVPQTAALTPDHKKTAGPQERTGRIGNCRA